MNHKSSRTKSSVAVLGTILAAGSLSACVGTPAYEYAQAAAVACPVEASEVSGTARMGYQVIPGADLFIQDQAVLEACLPNVEVSWIRFPTGQDVVQGFAANSADFGFLGSTPTAKALSAPLNLDVIVPQVNLVNHQSEALVAKNATDITELKGKKIATAFSSTSHYSLLQALHQAGMDPKADVQIVNISPDKLPAAWASDEIAAAFIWNPTLMEIQKTGTTLLDAEDVADKGAPTMNFTMVDRSYAEANPEILDLWIRLQNWAMEVYREDPETFIAANAAQSGMTEEETRQQLAGVKLITATEQPAALQDAAKALLDTAVFLEGEGGVSAHDAAHYHTATDSSWAEAALENHRPIGEKE